MKNPSREEIVDALRIRYHAHRRDIQAWRSRNFGANPADIAQRQLAAHQNMGGANECRELLDLLFGEVPGPDPFAKPEEEKQG